MVISISTMRNVIIVIVVIRVTMMIFMIIIFPEMLRLLTLIKDLSYKILMKIILKILKSSSGSLTEPTCKTTFPPRHKLQVKYQNVSSSFSAKLFLLSLLILVRIAKTRAYKRLIFSFAVYISIFESK